MRAIDRALYVVFAGWLTVAVARAFYGYLLVQTGGEWSAPLDDVSKDEAVWLPREDQLRELFGTAFHRLERDGEGYRVLIGESWYAGGSPAEAYGLALLELLTHG